MRAAKTTALVAVACVALLAAAAPASAGWHYNFKKFIKTSATTTSAGRTYVKRCAPSPAGEWRFFSQIEVEVAASSNPKFQDLELDVTAKMPITTKLKPVRDVDVSWRATLPKDPAEAALLTEHYERLAKSQEDFYGGMAVRWRPAKKRLEIEHAGLYYDEIEQLPPGSFSTHFNPQPGC